MRIGYSEDEDFPGQFELWQANCQRSLGGSAGQNTLRELEQALIALPEKRLIAGELENAEGEVCAIGALAKHRGLTSADIHADPEEMEEVGIELGMPRLVAWKIVEVNDVELGERKYRIPYTPEERYELMLSWVRGRIRPISQKRKTNHESNPKGNDMSESNEERLAKKVLAYLGDSAEHAMMTFAEDRSTFQELIDLAQKVTTASLSTMPKQSTVTSMDLVLGERLRQVVSEGFDAEHDDNEHEGGQLAMAAACYAAPVPIFTVEFCGDGDTHDAWPWGEEWDKREDHPRLKCLMIAGALILAEMDRLNRLQNRRHPQCTLCEGQAHHWDFDADDERPEGMMVCRHCSAERAVTDADVNALG